MFSEQSAYMSGSGSTDYGPAGLLARWRFGLIALLAIYVAGCSTIPPAPPTTKPIPVLDYRADNSMRQRNLLVLLRGYGEDNTVFAKEGLIEEVQRRHLPFDVVAPDAHFGYYRTQTLEARLKEDIIEPARRQGYKHIWLAGFSMGGLGCILYLRKYPNDVDGILLTSPFLGWNPILSEIGDAGGVETWQQTSDDKNDWQRMLWSWIKKHDFASETPVWLGYGDKDELISTGPMFMAARLPAGRAFTVQGEHDLATFKSIFLHHLDTLANQGNFPAKQLTGRNLKQVSTTASLPQNTEQELTH
jgi:pimeloyl-ACP methyl ester carboxylesterase